MLPEAARRAKPRAADWPSILDAPPGACQAGEGRCGAQESPVDRLPLYLEIRCHHGHHRYVRMPVAAAARRPAGTTLGTIMVRTPCKGCGQPVGWANSSGRRWHEECKDKGYRPYNHFAKRVAR